jgi:arylsulfatase A-like enzyme/alpha-L-fucosidase
MNLRHLTSVLAALLIASTPGCEQEPQEKAESAADTQRPNLVFIFADDMGYGEIQALNPERSNIPTPSLDSLAADGAIFTDAHTTSSVCSPSRYSLLTGRYNWRTRLQSRVVQGNDDPLIAEDRLTLAHLFREQGYSTAIFGKWHLDYNYEVPEHLQDIPEAENSDTINPSGFPVGTHIPDGPVTRGFDTFYGFHHAGAMSSIVRDDTIVEDLPTVDVLPALTREAVAYIDEKGAQARAGKPFFLYFPMSSPHGPIVPSEDWQGKSELGEYGDFIMQTDGSVGAVMEAIERNGLADNTVFIFSADNGTSKIADFEALQEKGHYPSANLRGSKADLWEGGHRVPFIVRWPGKLEPGTYRDQLVSMADMMATFAEFFGVELADDAAEDSFSFLPAIEGETVKDGRDAIVHHSIHGRFAIRQGPWKLLLAPGSAGWTAPLDRVAIARGLPEIQLYNLDVDIGEQNNLVAQYPGKVEELTLLLESLVAAGRSTPGEPQQNDTEIDIWKTELNLPEEPAKKKAEEQKAAGDDIDIRYPAGLEQTSDSEARLDQWFRDAKFGVFIHFGLYSPLAGQYQDGRGVERKYAEWIQYAAGIEKQEYEQLAASFDPADFDADEWVDVFARAGARYVVLTAKHHDGFSLYKSGVSDFNIVDGTPFGRDIVRELSEASRKRGLKFGVYFSQAKDWYDPNSLSTTEQLDAWKLHPYLPMDFDPSKKKYLADTAYPQITELVKNYDLDLIWFDTPRGLNTADASKFHDIVRENCPDCVINSRIVHIGWDELSQNMMELFDYVSLRDKEIPKNALSFYFESPDSVSTSYGYKKYGNVKYHSAKELIGRMVNTVCMGGNYLLNNGPMGNGRLDPEAVRLYGVIGDWLEVNRESVIDTRPNPLGQLFDFGNICRSKSGDVLYVHVLEWPADGELEIEGISGVRAATFLADGQDVAFRQDGDQLTISLPDQPLDAYSTVVKLELDQPL